MALPRARGVRTARKLLVGIGIGLAFIAFCSVAALISLAQLNAIVRHLAFDPVPGAAAIASIAKDFNQYRVLEASSSTAGGPRDAFFARKATDITRDLKAYDDTITQDDDRRRFTELVALWAHYADLHDATAAQKASEEIDALLITMIEWNRQEGVRSIQKADSATRAASATVLSMLVAALLLSALAVHFNRTVERPMNALAQTARAVALGNLDVRAKMDGPLEVATVARELNEMLDARAQPQRRTRGVARAVARPDRRSAAGQGGRTDHDCPRDSRRARRDAHRAQDGRGMDWPPGAR
jgi:methyl-accepting chemotaxis protein